jgi:hypothetical protein
MFLRNLNVFVACFVIAGMTIAGPVALLLSIPLSLLTGQRSGGAFMYPIAYVAIALVLAVIWWKSGLSPSQRKPERERRFNNGHSLLGLVNVLAVVSFAGPLVMAKMTGNQNLSMLAWFALPVYALGFVAWPAGLFMVWSSRA